MKESSLITFLNDLRKWLVLFSLTYALSFYWLPEEIPLFYSQALPEDRLASKYWLLLLPLFILFFWWVIDIYLSRLTLHNENMLKLIKWFKIGLTVCVYVIFLKIILLVL